MKFSIVTPCYNSVNSIHRCIASVADQCKINVEHILQDGGSTDGTLDILEANTKIKVVSEIDTGMYDALNKGFDRATGDILAHINADEQYLPKALHIVSDFFDNHPDVDILFTDVLVLRDDSSLVCYQKIIKPTRAQILLSHLPTYTAGTFFRRRIWEDGLRFDTSKKALGDSWWMLKILESKYNTACKHHFTTIVTATEENLSLSNIAHKESRELFDMVGVFARTQWVLQFIRYRIAKMSHGCYRQKKFSYSVYTKHNLHTRKTFIVTNPSPFWMQMHKLKSLNYYSAKQ